MKYEEIAEKLKTGQKVYNTDVSGAQVFKLLHDGLVKSLRYHKELYEINFIPMDNPMDTTIHIDNNLYPDYESIAKVFKSIIELYKNNKPIYIALDDEFYELILDILETE